MWRHQGVTTGKRSDASRFLLIRSAAKKLPPCRLTTTHSQEYVASVGHLVAKALKT
jgi:hypothetical protein